MSADRVMGEATPGNAGCDIVLVGVGGQGILTIGEILLHAALESGVAASFAPTKGMAQRGGFVKAELRLGKDRVGPRIAAGAADLVLATERSEALRGIPYVKRGGAFVLYDDVWAPTEVMLGTAGYPSRDVVAAAVQAAEARLTVLIPSDIPLLDGHPAAVNLVVLGAACSVPTLAQVVDAAVVEKIIAARWPRVAAANVRAFHLGLTSVESR